MIYSSESHPELTAGSAPSYRKEKEEATDEAIAERGMRVKAPPCVPVGACFKIIKKFGSML